MSRHVASAGQWDGSVSGRTCGLMTRARRPGWLPPST